MAEECESLSVQLKFWLLISHLPSSSPLILILLRTHRFIGLVFVLSMTCNLMLMSYFSKSKGGGYYGEIANIQLVQQYALF